MVSEATNQKKDVKIRNEIVDDVNKMENDAILARWMGRIIYPYGQASQIESCSHQE
ncbi:unnamed protein product [Dovyalis caffra]|uniref:Uncharacterized protein n=1 Tax=Dovyalis caffra TaxID=77055 RepID=A0AAV1SSC1_9ROSI|nr:unnamed protein product [Dovyalis caffra]